MADVTANQGFVRQYDPNQPAGPQEYWTDAGAVRGPVAETEAKTLAGRSMALIADPAPLGLAGFAATTWTISTVTAGWHAAWALGQAVPIALFFGGVAQFLAGMWAFRRGNVLQSTAFSTFGAFNFAFGIWYLLMALHLIPPVHFGAVTGGQSAAYVAGWFIITFGVVAGYLAIAALADNLVLVGILVTLCLTYALDGVGIMIVGSNNWALYIGGYAGIISSLLAFYLSAAIVINASFQREIVPMFHTRGPGQKITQPTTGQMPGPSVGPRR